MADEQTQTNTENKTPLIDQAPDQAAGNPSANEVAEKAEGLTGEVLLKKIKACREETKDLLSKVPYKLKQDTFNNVLKQIQNDQDICLAYINILSENVKQLKKEQIGNLPDALSNTKNRLLGEKRMVVTLREENPFADKNMGENQIKEKKIEELYTISSFLGFARGQEDLEWKNYERFSQELQAKQQAPDKEVPTESAFNPFSIIVILFIVFVILKRSDWGKNLVSKAIEATKDPKTDQKEDKNEDKKE